MKKIVFLTGTRADYGKLKSLMLEIDQSSDFELNLFITGMHMHSRYGSTWREIEKDGFRQVYHFINQNHSTPMDLTLSNTISGLSNYVSEIQPDLIVVHGDRLEALAGAIVGAFNNILVAHIEGGEVSGTIDESIRHAITKFAHLHFVSNEESKRRIMQLGEKSEHIHVIGSPDIDIMYSKTLPSLEKVKQRYEIPFSSYGIVMYHPVTTEVKLLPQHIKEFKQALLQSDDNYIVIYPNNDKGSDLIIDAYQELGIHPRFQVYPSIRFEYFLTLLKNAKFIIGNSSAGIREAGIYGTPTIDVGNRQHGRYVYGQDRMIQHVEEKHESILEAICSVPEHGVAKSSNFFGSGDSSERFMEILKSSAIWNTYIQKRFLDLVVGGVHAL
nr:UDP-N-acetylglucosamine 2-epimerase [Paenibacillus xylanexedens]